MNKVEEFENHVVVKESSIHGAGIFADADIPAGSIIMKITGEVISPDECERREEEDNNVYIFWNGDDNYIDTMNTEKIKFINHNCDYNCEVEEGDETFLYLIADRNIKAGEELTIDYGYDEIYDYCNCGKCSSRSSILKWFKFPFTFNK